MPQEPSSDALAALQVRGADNSPERLGEGVDSATVDWECRSALSASLCDHQVRNVMERLGV